MITLLVEDDENKREQIRAVITEKFPDFRLEEASSLIGALRAAQRLRPKLVILDMTIPNYESLEPSGGGEMHHFGGEEFMRQIVRFGLDTNVIVVSQFETFGSPPNRKTFEELKSELAAQFRGLYKGAVYYHASLADWGEALEALIIETLKAEESHNGD